MARKHSMKQLKNKLKQVRKPDMKALELQQRKKTLERKLNKKDQTRRYCPPFRRDHVFLLVGEGNFSFAKSMMLHHVDEKGSLIATSFDSKEQVQEKYPDAAGHIQAIEERGGFVYHGVDARQLHKNKQLRSKRFDTILWNFPHTGRGIKDQDRNIREHQNLMLEFLQSAEKLLSNQGVVVVTLAETKPYTLWNLRQLAKSCGLMSLMSEKFDSSYYPEYEHRRTVGWIDGISELSPWKGELRDSRHYCFVPKGSSVKPYNQFSSRRPTITDDGGGTGTDEDYENF
ncbi:ribosome biogenesis protein [Schizosaccharomyces japonicus yFS275]|uniref:Ribosome biogenesis protein n=1 Tax=Schizosaccharomyces japonicus (strain yFS275 / FY16936) TaxID=402676 RepID=B6K326_SCHJY|nr:ribosome biogenesis protein [Schizosaccharomyces japonicus yFS275]EEB07883.1 ribosome biogenesis protein [Schizosaccharomyces japonicus yFS275]